MKIFIDARFTRIGRHDGISRYGASLIREAAQYADVTMLVHDERQLELLPDVPYLRINSPLSPLEAFVAFRLNRFQPDVVFCPMQTMGSLGRKYALILTLHDLIYYQNRTPPQFLPLPVRLLWRLYHLAYWPQRLLLNRADVVVTISRTTADLMTRHRLTRRPIRIVGNAPQAPLPRRPAEAAPEKSLLYMGSFMPYKNVETLLAGMSGLEGYTLHLLSAISDRRRRELEATVPAGARVVFHDGVSESEYRDLLHRAIALVSLSRAEGFGLPVIEAMAAGTPVIVSDIPIFREVAGDAAVFVNPDRPAAFTDAVRGLAERQAWDRLSLAGLAQAANYSWESSARNLLEAAVQAVARNRRV
jgi:glycosyltransferase involved in cell wall biosynthesis